MSAFRPSRAGSLPGAFGIGFSRVQASSRRSRRIAIGACAVIGLTAWTAFVPPVPRLVWNASSSAPLGLWLVSPGDTVFRGEMVAARMPKPWRRFAAVRRYLPERVPLVKRVAALPGDEICGFGGQVFLNGKPLVERLKRDGSQRWLPWWEGCSRLREGEYLLLIAENRRSFDGRYFGVTKASEIMGPARLIWAR